MEQCVMVSIAKLAVLMEDFSDIETLIEASAEDPQKLLDARNTWEVFFAEYDDDPREIPEIPEVKNWIHASLEAGIPWFYFMRTDSSSLGLRAFITAYAGVRDAQEHYQIDRTLLQQFLEKNLKNLFDFAAQYELPPDAAEEAGNAVIDSVMHFLSGGADAPETETDQPALPKETMKQEALERLHQLETLYGLNPKVARYFAEGRLYYSYLTGGGYLGSIDTITYDERYEKIARSFEEQTSALVYHAIEYQNTLSLLFVSPDITCWQDERPSNCGVQALTVDLDSQEKTLGCIELDSFDGALLRKNPNISSALPENKPELSSSDSEIVERFRILTNVGMITDLDLPGLFLRKRELFYSELMTLMGQKVGVVDQLSASPDRKYLVQALSAQIPDRIYFVMDTLDGKMAFLFVSKNPKKWEMEKRQLEQCCPYAIVLDPDEMTASMAPIHFTMVNGGPVGILDIG